MPNLEKDLEAIFMKIPWNDATLLQILSLMQNLLQFLLRKSYEEIHNLARIEKNSTVCPLYALTFSKDA